MIRHKEKYIFVYIRKMYFYFVPDVVPADHGEYLERGLLFDPAQW